MVEGLHPWSEPCFVLLFATQDEYACVCVCLFVCCVIFVCPLAQTHRRSQQELWRPLLEVQAW